jgi:hypothetical protein
MAAPPSQGRFNRLKVANQLFFWLPSLFVGPLEVAGTICIFRKGRNIPTSLRLSQAAQEQVDSWPKKEEAPSQIYEKPNTVEQNPPGLLRVLSFIVYLLVSAR